MAGGEIGAEGGGNAFGGIQVTEIKRAVDAHENSLGGGALVGAIALGDLADQDGGSDLTFVNVDALAKTPFRAILPPLALAPGPFF